MNTVEPPVRVEIWSDPQCVWCYIAHPRFQRAVAAFDRDVEVTYRSFELHPDAPIEIDKEEHIRERTQMNAEQRNRINAQLAELAAVEGLTYRPDLTQPTNSRLALELHHADTTGHRPALTDRLFTAYFTEGRHIGHIYELLALAAEIGIEPDTARHALADRRHARDVNKDSSRLRALGARGVPLYVINGTQGISGAQPTEIYLSALENAANV